jgi:hypothetical protein
MLSHKLTLSQARRRLAGPFARCVSTKPAVEQPGRRDVARSTSAMLGRAKDAAAIDVGS